MSARSSTALAVAGEIAITTRALVPEISWAELARRAPQMAPTMARYLDQLAVSARPATVDATRVDVAPVRRSRHRRRPRLSRWSLVRSTRHLEDYKRWLARPSRPKAGTLTTTTISAALGLLRTFFERIIDWDYDDAPTPVPIFAGDFPNRDEPLPKFLDDPTAAKFMATLATDPNRRRRLMVELLARTGIRVRGTRRSRRRRDGPHRRHVLAAHPASASSTTTATSHSHPLLVELINDHRTRRGPSTHRAARRTQRRPTLRPAHHPPLRHRRRHTRRRRPRPPAPTAPHPRHPSDQPWDEPRSDRRAARTSLDAT